MRAGVIQIKERTMKKKGVECSKCWYWHKEGENMGECRANPPIPPIYIPNEARAVKSKGGIWLQTNGEDWCGNFKPEQK
jgi:hypothetical protein